MVGNERKPVIKGMDIEECTSCRGTMYTFGHRKNAYKICNDCIITKQPATWRALQIANNGHSPERGL